MPIKGKNIDEVNGNINIIKMKQMTATELSTYTPLAGEIILNTTTANSYIGDGVTVGGVLLSGGTALVETVDIPTLVSPTNLVTDIAISSDILLEASVFVGDGTPNETQIQLTDSADTGFATPLINKVVPYANPTTFTITGTDLALLTNSSSYIWRVKYSNNNNVWSEYSLQFTFTTAVAPATIYSNKTAAIADGLSHYWILREDVLGQSINDITDPNDALVNTDITFATNTFNQYDLMASFDGITSYMYGATSGNFDGKGTYSFSFRRNVTGVYNVLCQVGTSYPYLRFFLNADNTLGIYMIFPSPYPKILHTTTMTFDNVTNYVIMYDIDKVAGILPADTISNIYVNGNAVATTRTDGTAVWPTSVFANQNLYIGTSTATPNIFNGVIGNFAIWENKLISELSFTPADLYNAGAGKRLY